MAGYSAGQLGDWLGGMVSWLLAGWLQGVGRLGLSWVGHGQIQNGRIGCGQSWSGGIKEVLTLGVNKKVVLAHYTVSHTSQLIGRSKTALLSVCLCVLVLVGSKGSSVDDQDQRRHRCAQGSRY